MTLASRILRQSHRTGHTLAEFTGGANSGWMCTLNDFFCNRSLSEFRVSATDPNYSLTDGDVIHVMYTTNGLGGDLGGSWNNSNTTLESLGVEGGELTSAFASGEAGGSYDYTLLIDGDSANITLTPTGREQELPRPDVPQCQGHRRGRRPGPL